MLNPALIRRRRTLILPAVSPIIPARAWLSRQSALDRRRASVEHRARIPGRESSGMNKWVLAAILVAAAVLMYVSIIYKLS